MNYNPKLMHEDRRCQGDVIVTLCVAHALVKLENICTKKAFSSKGTSRSDAVHVTDELSSRKTILLNRCVQMYEQILLFD